MKINEHTWKICKFKGNLWKFIEIPSKIDEDLRKFNEQQRKYITIHRNSQETYEMSWEFIRKFRKSITNPWKSTDNLCTWKLIEIQRKSMKFHGNPKENIANPWKSMKIYGKLMKTHEKSMKFEKNLCNFIEIHKNISKNHGNP